MQDKPISNDVLHRAAQIKLLLMDVDGVLTDGTIYFAPGADGKMVETKGFNSQDGLGLHFWNGLGLKSGVISGRDSPAVIERAKMLKMSYVYQGHLAKEMSFDQILMDAGVTDAETAFIGDDFTDAPLMRRAGLAVAVENAREEVKSVAHLITSKRGGDGAVREVIEVILKAQDLWNPIIEKYRLGKAVV